MAFQNHWTDLRSVGRTSSARMGNRMLAVAVLDATSVMVAVMTQMMKMMRNGGRLCRPASCSPSHSDRPDFSDASERAKPPPNNSTMSHGSLAWMYGLIDYRRKTSFSSIVIMIIMCAICAFCLKKREDWPSLALRSQRVLRRHVLRARRLYNT